jgi:hypothetical protein
MDSPYQPGPGARPNVMVGRERQLARAHAVLTRVANSGAPSSSALVLTGARGMGKTVTLGVIGDSARERGLVTAGVALDSVSDNTQLLATRIAEALKDYERGGARSAWARVRERLSALSIEVNAGVVRVTSDAPVSRAEAHSATQREALASLMSDGARLAVEHGRAGLAVFIDELQEAPHHDLVVIANAIQDALMVSDAPIAVFAAGLPQTPERVVAAASFTERFDFRSLEPFDPDAAERALVEPALALGVQWEVAAVHDVVAAAGGSPYLIQRLGDETWALAAPTIGSTLTADLAGQAISDVRESLVNGMFRGRWAKATTAERDLMVAIAQVVDADGVALSKHIAAVTGRTSPQLSSARHALLDKGLVEATGHGRLRFTMPGFAEFVRAQADVVWYGPAPAAALLARPPRELPPGPPAPPGPSGTPSGP